MSLSQRLRGPAAMAAIGLSAVGVALGASQVGALDRVEADSVDLRFDLRGERPSNDVAVVAIDGPTFSEVSQPWPFDRRLHARVVDSLRRAGARQIAYDVQFTEPTSAASDSALFDAVGRARHAVLSTTEVEDGGRTNVLGGDANLRSVGARAASTLTPRDGDGVVRRLPPHTIEELESFAVATAEQATGRQIPATDFPERPYVDFQGPPGTIDTLSFSSVLSGRFDHDRVRGKVVVVGASAPSLQDLHSTAASADSPMAGPELLANATSTVLRDFPLRDAPALLGTLAALLLGFLAPLASLRLGVARTALLSLAGLGAYLLAAKLAFDSGTVLAVAAPVLALGLGAVGALGLRLATEARERRRTRELFGRFVPEAVVDELLQAGGTARGLPGTRRDATVMFCDLRGFTGFAEARQPELVLEVLNRYLGEMSAAVLDHGGTVVSYMGDGIMAVFGSPVAREDHGAAAYVAAREMLDRRLPALNEWLAERDLPGFRMGIGLNSGPVMSGTVGSERRLEYATIGDTTNVAARLEAMTKRDGGGLLLSDSTRRLLGPKAVHGLSLHGDVEVRGRAGTLSVWTPKRPGNRAAPSTDVPAGVAS